MTGLRARLARLRTEEAGFSLVELLVASLLFVLVGSVIAGIFIATLTVQQTVSGVSSSTSNAQAAAQNIDTGIRNAWGFTVTPNGSDQLLVARVAGTGATLTWSCRAWYYSASAGTIRTYTGPQGTVIAAPTASALATWTLLTGNVTPRTGTTIFTNVDNVTLTTAYDVTGAGKKVAIQLSSSRPIGVTTTTLSASERCY